MKYCIIFILGGFILCSCEGFKVLTLHNASGQEARVVVKPGIDPWVQSNLILTNPPDSLLPDSSIHIVQTDSSLLLQSRFTSLMFGAGKLRPEELRIYSLRVESANDTIVASDKNEIILLTKNKHSRSDKKEAKPSRNWKTIIIR